MDSDGRVLVVGETNLPSKSAEIFLARILPDGRFDTEFAGGLVTEVSEHGVGANELTAVATRANGQIVVAGHTRLDPVGTGNQRKIYVRLYNSNGTIAGGFGKINGFPTSNGFGVFQFGSHDDRADAVAVSGTKVLVAGSSNQGSSQTPDYDFAVARLNHDGAFDTTFDTDGKVTFDIGTTASETTANSEDRAYGMALQPDGKVLVVGTSGTGTSARGVLMRLTAAGALDTTFDTDGILVLNNSDTNGNEARAVAVENDGTIWVVGSGVITETDQTTMMTTAASHRSGFIYELMADGTIANQLRVDLHGASNSLDDDTKDDVLTGIVVDDGNATVVGYRTDSSSSSFLITRVQDGGFETFGDSSADAALADGYTITDFGAQSDWSRASSIAMDSKGRLLVAGTTGAKGAFEGGTSVRADVAVARYLSSGLLDTSFGDGGKVVHDIRPSSNAKAVTIGAADRPVIVGSYGEGYRDDGNTRVDGTDNGFASSMFVMRLRDADGDDNALSALSGTSSTDGSTFSTAITLTPAFTPNVLSYRATVPNNVTHAQLTPTARSGSATIAFAAAGQTLSALTSGSTSAALPLTEGDNTFAVAVTAEDGSVATYRVTVRRQGTIALSVAADQVPERNPDSSAGSLAVTATLSVPAPPGGVAVTLTAQSASTAVLGTDFTLPAAFTIPKGQTTATGQVQIIVDGADEDDNDPDTDDHESIVLSATAGGRTVTGVTAYIVDSDESSINLSTESLEYNLQVTKDGFASAEFATYKMSLGTKPTSPVCIQVDADADAADGDEFLAARYYFFDDELRRDIYRGSECAIRFDPDDGTWSREFILEVWTV
ncbi:MAG: cadherin-like beta sandwich domain-containing protein, partial [Acidimicrobiaceae bacterium]|nr:cadherin-like beta sandwich domain-containing protein [Acidimicrobiaceae bacterium]